MVSHNLILAMGVIQLILQVGAAVLFILVAVKGRAKAGYFLAGGMIFFAIHNLGEILTEVEHLHTSAPKLITSIFFLYGAWILYNSVLKIEG